MNEVIVHIVTPFPSSQQVGSFDGSYTSKSGGLSKPRCV
jgi:hypothetical protein